MKSFLLIMLFMLVAAAVIRAAEPPVVPPDHGVDTSFLKKFAETRRFMVGRPQNPKVAPDGKTVLFLRGSPDDPKLKLFEFDVATGQTRELLSPAALLQGDDENLTPEEKARRERMRVSAGGFADFHFNKDGSQLLLPLSGRLFVFDRTTKKVTELKTGDTGAIVDPKWSPDGTKIAYVRGYDVYVVDLATNRESAVTRGGTLTKTHGLAEFVAQEEMGRFTGYWWSPDSQSIAYEEADHTGVETWYVADPFRPEQKPLAQFYPRPGQKNVSVRLGIIPVAGGETVWVNWDRERYEYLAAVRWHTVGPLTIQVQDRKQQKLLLLSVDPKTGQTQKLVEEKDSAWVNLSQEVPVYESGLGGFIWLGTDPNGEAELQLRDATGVLQDVLVAASQRPEKLLQVHSSRDNTFVVYTGGADPTQQHVFRHRTPVRLRDPSSENDERLTNEPGVHSAVVGTHGQPYVITSTTAQSMPKSVVYNRDGVRLGELPSVAQEPDGKIDVTFLRVGAGDDSYNAAIVRPHDFDPRKKYPVIVDVYGGPKHVHVVQAMRQWLVPQWLANQGFIVVAIDNRGTPGRGRAWERAIYQKFGTVPLDDQVKGLRLLCEKFPAMDPDRVGIVGWSFGGYMAANAVLRRPEVFKAAVAGAPVTDWEDYDTHYTERYLGLLPESKKAYDDANLIPLAKNLQRPLLLVHGTADDNVYFRHTLKLANALLRAGRDFETLPLPGITHMYSSDPAVMEQLWARTARFFRRHLGGPK